MLCPEILCPNKYSRYPLTVPTDHYSMSLQVIKPINQKTINQKIHKKQEKTQQNCPRTEVSLSEQNIEEIINSSFTSDIPGILAKNSSDSDEPLFDPVDEQYQLSQAKIAEIRENLNSRPDNVIKFVSSQGKSCDEGARILQSLGKLPLIRNAMVGPCHRF